MPGHARDEPCGRRESGRSASPARPGAPVTASSAAPARGRLRAFESGAADERIEAALGFLAALPPGGEALVVGATREAADDLVRRRTATAGATFGLHRASLVQLAARVAGAELARRGAAPTGALGVE